MSGVTSDWDATLSILDNIAFAIRDVNRAAAHAAETKDYAPYEQKLWFLFMNMSFVLSEQEYNTMMSQLKNINGHSEKDSAENWITFFEVRHNLQSLAQRHKLLLKEAEDTSFHGGRF